MTDWRIVCDVGGSNVRYARSQADRGLTDIVSEPVLHGTTITTSLLKYSDRFDDLGDLAGIAIAAAGPSDNHCIKLTNRDLTIHAEEVSRSFAGKSVTLLNDLEAVALSLPWLTAADLHSVLAVDAPLSGPRLVVNVGTGFGGALLLDVQGQWHSIACEPGHMKLVRDLMKDPALAGQYRLVLSKKSSAGQR